MRNMLHGNTHAKKITIFAVSRFKLQGPGCPNVMLLSMEDAASGANLTEANHVFFVHPFLSSDKNLAAAYEAQAIGRVAR